jgi:DNA-binding transcriptional MerR regulator
MSKSAPKAPDYAAAAETQADSSRDVTEQQTWANRPDINTPFGSQTWENNAQWDPTTQQYINRWEQNTNLTPEAQSALDSQLRLTQGRSNLAEGLLGRVQDEFGDTMDWSQFTPMGQAPQANQYGQNLPEFGATPDVPTYDLNGAPARGQGPGQEQYTPEQIQRSLSTEGLQNVDPSQRYYDNAGNAIYDQFSSRAEPQFSRDTEALRTQLYNQGLREGDEAYDRELEKQRQSQNDARQQASYQATIGAGSEAQRMQGMDLSTRGQQFGERNATGAFANQAADQALNQQLGIGNQRFTQGMQGAQLSDAQRAAAVQEQLGVGGQKFQQEMAASGQQDQQRQQAGQEQLAFGQNRFAEQMQGSNYQNQVRQQQIAEEMQRRGFSLNEVQALLSGQQVAMPNMPSFNTASRAEGNQALSAAQMQGQAALDAFNAQNQQMQGLMSGATSSAMMFSDRRLKENIVKVGTGFRGLPIYQFNYIWDRPDDVRMGYMADEVEAILPEAVRENETGYKMVNYELIARQH